jgi:hypothetical protein
MMPYEFETAVMDGIIRIPVEYKNKIKGKVKVILLSEDVEKNVAAKKFSFPYFAVDTTNYVFDREEANER